MRKRLYSQISINFFSSALILFLVSCGSPDSEKKASLPTPSNSNALLTSANSPATKVTPAPDGFPVDKICSLPTEIARNSPFGALGGGKWAKWGDDSEGGLNYGCSGGKDSVKLEQETAKITARYDVMGEASAAHYVSTKYTSLQYGGKPPAEKGLRQAYINFCDELSTKFYGHPLPEKLKKHLQDETTFSPSEKPHNYHEKVANGYVNLAARREGDAMVALEIRFFASEAEYKKYKDS